MVDLRKDKRAPASLKVKYKSVTVDQFIDQFGTDVSRGGIFVKTKKPIEIGALLKLELQLNDASPVIHGIGRVCWRREPGPDPSIAAGMGIKFIKLDPDSRAVVERIVQHRGDRPSRFEQTEGAEIAAPSISPPPPSGAPPPITVPPPSVAPLFAPKSTPPIAVPSAKIPTRAAAPVSPGVPAAPIKKPAPVTSPGQIAAPAPIAAPKPAASKPAGSRAVAGLFADSPLSRSVGAEPGGELRSRSSFFPPAPSNGSGSLSRPSSGRPTSGRSEQARQSGQFLATAFAEGGLAEDTTAQARAAAEAGTDELLDELFDEAVKTSEHPAPPPMATAATDAVRASQPSPMRESVDDMFAELSEEEGLSSPPPQRSAPNAFPSAPAPLAREFEDERTTQRSSVDDLLDDLDDQSAQDAAAAPADPGFDDDDGFGEAEVFAASKPPRDMDGLSEPPAPRIPSSMPAAPPEVANAMERGQRSNALPLIVALVLVAAGGGGFYLYQANQAAQQAEVVQQQQQPAPAPTPAPVVVEPSAAPDQAPSQPAAAAPDQPGAAQPAGEQAAAAPAHAEAAAPSAPARSIDVEVSSVPRGADISIDGKVVGSTPAHVALVVDKSTEVRVSMAGYTPMIRTLVPSVNNEPLRFKLEPLPYTLIVRSTPPDAQLAVGEHVARAPAPLDLGHLDGGVQVSISKDGFQRMTRLVRLDEFTEQAGVMRAEIEVTLSPLPGGAEVQHARPRPRARTAADAPPAPSPNEPETSAPSDKAAPAESAPAAAKPAAAPAAEPAPAPAAE